jgi:uncharacterized protein (DUF1697 family)
MVRKYCVFLRGVNVNGVKMKMDELKKTFADMPYGDARTVLATGNVIVSSDESPSVMKAAIEAALGSRFHYDACVFLRSAAELKSVVADSKSVAVPEGCHLYYLLCDNKDTVRELAGVFASLPHKQSEAFIPVETGAFWIVPVGETLESPFGSKALGARKYKDQLTSRNMNTIEKILQAMDD